MSCNQRLTLGALARESIKHSSYYIIQKEREIQRMVHVFDPFIFFFDDFSVELPAFFRRTLFHRFHRFLMMPVTETSLRNQEEWKKKNNNTKICRFRRTTTVQCFLNSFVSKNL